MPPPGMGFHVNRGRADETHQPGIASLSESDMPRYLDDTEDPNCILDIIDHKQYCKPSTAWKAIMDGVITFEPISVPKDEGILRRALFEILPRLNITDFIPKCIPLRVNGVPVDCSRPENYQSRPENHQPPLEKRRGGGGSSFTDDGGYSQGSPDPSDTSSAGSVPAAEVASVPTKPYFTPEQLAAPVPKPASPSAPKESLPKLESPETKPIAKPAVPNPVEPAPPPVSKPRPVAPGVENTPGGIFDVFTNNVGKLFANPTTAGDAENPVYFEPHYAHVSGPNREVEREQIPDADQELQCGTTCRNALIGTFSSVALLSALALIIWWLVVKRRRKSKRNTLLPSDDRDVEAGVDNNTKIEKTSASSLADQNNDLFPDHGDTADEKMPLTLTEPVDEKAPRVTLGDRGSFELPQVLTATEVSGRGSPVLVQVPRSSRSESGKSRGSRESTKSNEMSSLELNSVTEERARSCNGDDSVPSDTTPETSRSIETQDQEVREAGRRDSMVGALDAVVIPSSEMDVLSQTPEAGSRLTQDFLDLQVKIKAFLEKAEEHRQQSLKAESMKRT